MITPTSLLRSLAALALLVPLAPACDSGGGGAVGPAVDTGAAVDSGATADSGGVTDTAGSPDEGPMADPGAADPGAGEDTAGPPDVPGPTDVGTPDPGTTPDAGSASDPGGTSDPGAGSPDAGPEGACTGADDTQALATAQDIPGTMQGCAMSCLSPGAACNSCVQEGLGISEGCAGCFADMMTCTVANCAMACLNPSSAGCLECQQSSCFPAFEACSGVSPPG